MRLFFIVLTILSISAEAKVYNLGSSSQFKSNRVLLDGNRSVTLKRFPGQETKVVFEDPLPRANWGHPAKIKILNEFDQVLAETTVTSPPKGWQKMKSDDVLLPVTTKAVIKLQSDGRYTLKDPSKHFAILINGNASQRHWNDYAFLYKTLTEIYGFSRANIFIADSFHKAEAPDLDDDGKPDIEYESTIDGIRNLFQTLKTTLQADSDLLIVVNDHGEIKNGQPVLVVNDGDIPAKDLTQWIASLPPKRAISVFQQCFGGGFVRGSVGEFRVALSASTDQEFSWATENMQYDEFLYHLTSAFAAQNPDGKPVNVDSNRDGKISVQEAFSYALNRDVAAENPLLEAYPNSGFAQLFGIHF